MVIAAGARDRNLNVKNAVLNHPAQALDGVPFKRVGVRHARGTDDRSDPVESPLIIGGQFAKLVAIMRKEFGCDHYSNLPSIRGGEKLREPVRKCRDPSGAEPAEGTKDMG